MIKVCGMRDPENIRAVAALGIDLMGFIFYPQSPRYVQMISSRAGIIPDYSAERLNEVRGSKTPGDRQELPRKPYKVGVFVDDMPQNIVTRVYNYDLDYVQLHGSERPVMIDNLRRTLDPDIRPGIKIIKALSIKGKDDVDQWRHYQGVADMLLFDTQCPGRGGSGEQFDWSVLDAYDGDIPFLLSGGIGPDDADRVRAFRHPMCVGIDLNSRFETGPGIKDVAQLATFIDAVRRS